MLLRFAIVVTLLELVLTAAASILVTYTEAPPAFATENDLRDLGIAFAEHRNVRGGPMNSPTYESIVTLSSPTATLYVEMRTDSSRIDFGFRRSREEVISKNPELGESVIINEPLPGEEGYAVRHRGPNAVRFELVRLRGSDMLKVRVVRKTPYENLPAAELSRCERRARVVQEHLMMKLRWRE
jgi:hypothetical protein